MILIVIKLQQHRKWWFYLCYQDFHPSSIRELAHRCGDAANAEVRCQLRRREREVNSRRLNTMSNNDDIRYCHRFSYVFLKFLLFFYSIVFWVSWAVSIGRSAACVGLCVAMFMGWRRWTCGVFRRNDMLGSSKHAESNQWMVKGEDFTPRPLLWFAALKRQVLSPVEQ